MLVALGWAIAVDGLVSQVICSRLRFDEDALGTGNPRFDLTFDRRGMPFHFAKGEAIAEFDAYVYEDILGTLMHRKHLVYALYRRLRAEYLSDLFDDFGICTLADQERFRFLSEEDRRVGQNEADQD